MKLARLLCALWVCGPLALGAGATESPVHDGATSNRDASMGRHAAVAAAPRRGSVSPPRSADRMVHGSANRPSALRSAEAHGSIAPAAVRRAGPHAAAAGANASTRGRGFPQAGPWPAPSPPVATRATRALPSVKMVRGSAVGGPHAAGPGRLGGPATGRTAKIAVNDGTQMHRRF
jgi:hypothetical protein